MSGGAFDYSQARVADIAMRIEQEIRDSGRKKTKREIADETYHDRYGNEIPPSELMHYKYPDEVIDKFREAIKALDVAFVYAQRVDWLLSGDDSEETFLERLANDLSKLEEYDNNKE